MNSQGYSTAQEVQSALRGVYKADREIDLQQALLHALRDKVKPLTPTGRWRAHPLLVSLAMLGAAAAGIVIFLSHRGPS